MYYNLAQTLTSEYHSPSIKIEDFKLNTYNPINPISTKGGGVKMLKLLIQMSYNMPKVFSSEFQSNSIEIEDFKINPINPFNPMSTKGGSENFKSITKNVL